MLQSVGSHNSSLAAKKWREEAKEGENKNKKKREATREQKKKKEENCVCKKASLFCTQETEEATQSAKNTNSRLKSTCSIDNNIDNDDHHPFGVDATGLPCSSFGVHALKTLSRGWRCCWGPTTDRRTRSRMKNSIIYYFYCTCVPKKKYSSSDALTLFIASQFCCWCGFFSSWIFSLLQRVSFSCAQSKGSSEEEKTAFSALYRHLFFVHRRGLRLRDIYVSPYNPNSTLILSTNIHLSFIHSKFMTLNPFRALKLFLMDNSWLMEVKAALQQLIEEKKEIYSIPLKWLCTAYIYIYESYIWIIHNQLS